MTSLKLHASGESDFLEALKKHYSALVVKIKKDNVFEDEAKTEALQKAKRDFESAKKSAKKSLF